MFPHSLRIASYNIRKAIGTDRRRDPERILRVIQSLQADIVMLQEADRRLPPRATALPLDRLQTLTGLVPVQYRQHTPSLGEHGNALLVNPEFEIEQTYTIDLPGLEPRGMVAARLKAPDGQSLCAIGLHLGLQRVARRRQVRALLEWLHATDMSGLPTVLAGDLNERSKTKGLDDLHGYLTLLPARNSFHARFPRWPLDRIAISRHFQPVAPPQVILNDETQLASDHLPIVVELQYRETN